MTPFLPRTLAIVSTPILRQALDPLRIADLLAEAGWSGPLPVLLATTESTNADAVRLATDGAPEGSCVVAEEQTAGRGRLGRTWASPPHAGLWLSVVIRAADQPRPRLAWLALVAGLAARDAVRSLGSVPVALKWPNDLVMETAACGGGGGPVKLGGILSEALADGTVILGIGINVSMRSAELPFANATSLFLESGPQDREALLAALLVHLRDRLAQWRAHDPSLADDYQHACLTIGRLVEVSMPDGSVIRGICESIDADGHLVVDTQGIRATITAGDVIHATI